MANRNKIAIGYFAFVSPSEVLCTGDTGNACVITGSMKAMNSFIAEINPDGQKKHIIKKTSFGEILSGLKLGAAYGFDEKSYKKFYPLARQEGLSVAEANFEEMNSKGLCFFIVQLKKI
ncbi:MAG: hypothetical protein HQK67_05935 [Desulfamplus sp.]|nr:hypothetical protein [Desulfamplus sp.]